MRNYNVFAKVKAILILVYIKDKWLLYKENQ